jgi:hypothetical protein
VRERIKILCEAAVSNGPDSWQAAIRLFEGVATLPARASDRDNLLEDASPALCRLCWFCQKQLGDAGTSAPVHLHGQITRTRTGPGESVHWDRQVIEVPRCWHCAQAHQSWDMLERIAAAPSGVRPEADKLAFPFVVKYLVDGWRLGIAPDNL